MSFLDTNWCGTRGLSGLGDFNDAMASMIAGGELSKLTSAIFKIQDELISASSSRAAVLEGFQKAEALYYEAASNDVGDLTVFLEAIEGAKLGVRLYARQIQTLTQFEIILSKVSSSLYSAGLTNDSNAVDQTVAQIRRFVSDTDSAFGGIPEYSKTKLSIISAFASELSRAGISRNDYANPAWFSAFGRAASAVVPIENEPSAPEGLGGGLGALPLLAVAILYGLAIVAATIVAIVSVRSVIAALNSKAETAGKLILQRSSDREVLRRQLYAQGASEEVIDSTLSKFDEDTKKDLNNIPGSSLLSELLVPIGIGIATLFGLKKAGIL